MVRGPGWKHSWVATSPRQTQRSPVGRETLCGCTLCLSFMASYIHFAKWGSLLIGRFYGRYIYRQKATDLRITEIDAASFFQGRRPKARPKSVKTFLVGRNWLPWAAAELLPRKISYESGRATSPLRLRRRCLRNSSDLATKTITNVCSCYFRSLPANGFC